jgi:hypothetical protein
MTCMKVGRYLATLFAAFCFSACSDEAAKSALLLADVPRLTIESVRGTYTGSMTTVRGVEAVVLQIQEIAPLQKGFGFRYTLKALEQREDGLGTLQPDGTSTRVCFAGDVCGWLISEDGRVRISADSDSNSLNSPIWSLEKF